VIITALVMFTSFFSLDLGVAADSTSIAFVVPELTGPVVDEAGILKPNTKRALDGALRALKNSGGSQINILTLRSLKGLPIEQASIKVVDAWKLGGKKSDNGILFLIAAEEHRMRIEVGQGLEGLLTDVESKRIIEDAVRPLFKAGDYDSGVIVGIYRIAQKTDPTIDLKPYLEGQVERHRVSSGRSAHPLFRLLFFILIGAIFILVKIFGGGGRGGGGGFPGVFGGGSGRGSDGDSGGSWSGGGGGFSGGGSSGDW
jgi:uncharacterized protein